MLNRKVLKHKRLTICPVWSFSLFNQSTSWNQVNPVKKGVTLNTREWANGNPNSHKKFYNIKSASFCPRKRKLNSIWNHENNKVDAFLRSIFWSTPKVLYIDDQHPLAYFNFFHNFLLSCKYTLPAVLEESFIRRSN